MNNFTTLIECAEKTFAEYEQCRGTFISLPSPLQKPRFCYLGAAWFGCTGDAELLSNTWNDLDDVVECIGEKFNLDSDTLNKIIDLNDKKGVEWEVISGLLKRGQEAIDYYFVESEDDDNE